MNIEIFSGILYFIIFIDDCSKISLAFTLEHRDLVLNVFKYFHVYVVRETRETLICIML